FSARPQWGRSRSRISPTDYSGVLSQGRLQFPVRLRRIHEHLLEPGPCIGGKSNDLLLAHDGVRFLQGSVVNEVRQGLVSVAGRAFQLSLGLCTDAQADPVRALSCS